MKWIGFDLLLISFLSAEITVALCANNKLKIPKPFLFDPPETMHTKYLFFM
jgi:hypothetical protein